MAFSGSLIKDKRGYLTVDQIHKIFNSIEKQRDKLVLMLMYHCARRVSEILLIRKKDILPKSSQIIFNILKRRAPTREIKPCPRFLMDELWDYVQEKKLRGNKIVFPIDRRTVWWFLRKYSDAVGVKRVGNKRVHPHHLRHSKAVHLVQQGKIKDIESLRKLQRLLAHTNVNSTMHYLQFDPKDLRSLVE